MKRSGVASGTNGNPDFKRPRARVGKRAPKAANLTETSFRAASLHVSEQQASLSTTNTDGVITSRGKTVADLVHQVGHPAAAVRTSAAKGLLHLLLQHKQQESSLPQEWSLLIPACTKCACVDEDDAVRTVGLQCLQALLSQNHHHNNSSSSLRPFAPLIVAYLSSALNSLDPHIRLDGCKAVEIVAQNGLLSLSEHQYHNKLLPPYIRLLKNNDQQQHAAKHKEPILKSLVALLLCGFPTNHNQNQKINLIEEEPDLVVDFDPQARPALFLEGRQHSNCSLSMIHKMDQLPVLSSVNEWYRHRNPSSTPQDSSESNSVHHDLLAKLRDVLLEEVTPQEATTATSGNKQQKQDPERSSFSSSKLHLAVQATRLMYSSQDAATTEPEEKLASHILSLLLETLPMIQAQAQAQQQGNHEHETMQQLHAELCTTIVQIATSFDFEATSSTNHLDWRTPVVQEYLLPQLASLQNSSSPNHSSSSSSSNMAILSVLRALLLGASDNHHNKKQARLLVSHIQQAFFPITTTTTEQQQPCSVEWMRSALGRRLVALMIDHFVQVVHDEEQPQYMSMIQSMLRHYVVAWAGDFPSDSARVLFLYHSILRRTTVTDTGLVHEFRTVLPLLLKAVPNKDGNSKKSKKASIFEQYPERLQRLVMSCMVLAEAPCEGSVQALGVVCSKSSDDSMANYIVECIHTIRKTISLQAYLGFVLTSTGLMSKVKKNKNVNILQYDPAVARACRTLVQAGTDKVVPMILPVLLDWLKSNEKLAHQRAALGMLALFSIDRTSRHGDSSSIFDILCPTDMDMKETVLQAMVSIIQQDFTSSSSSSLTFEQWSAPLVGLLETEPFLLEGLFQTVATRLENDDNDASSSSAVAHDLSVLVELVNTPRLLQMICQFQKPLLQHAKAMEQRFTNNENDAISNNSSQQTKQLAQRLLSLLELKTGETSTSTTSNQ